jgi:hypothetical protein
LKEILSLSIVISQLNKSTKNTNLLSLISLNQDAQEGKFGTINFEHFSWISKIDNSVFVSILDDFSLKKQLSCLTFVFKINLLTAFFSVSLAFLSNI